MATPTLSYMADDILADALVENSQTLVKKYTRKAKTEIQRFFAGHILLTGATGNLGKVVLEKLLRTCPKIKTLYITMRTKNGLSPGTRKEKLLEESIFSKILQEYPELKEKVIPIPSDLSEVGLSLSDTDKKILKDKVSVIIHCAAAVNDDESLSTTARTNVRGTLELLNFAKECINLRAFTHLSPLFAHSGESEICEKFYNLSPMAQNLMELKDTDLEAISTLEAKILKEFPNFHIFTKALAENIIQKLVEKFKDDMPVCIVRPSCICAAYKAPIPGWIQADYSSLAVAQGIAYGYVDDKQIVDIVPVDYAANLVLVATYNLAVKTRNESSPYVPIYNLSNYEKNSITWGQYNKQITKYKRENPTKDVWYHFGLRTTNMLLYRYLDFVIHYVPAVVQDLYLGVAGQGLKHLEIYHKFSKRGDRMGIRSLPVRSPGTRRLWSRVLQADKALFPFNIEQVDWEEFIEVQCAGIRKYAVENDVSTIPFARQQFQRLSSIQLVIFTLWHAFVLFLLNKLFTFLML